MLDKYLRAFAHLNRSPSRVWSTATKKKAPHKPLLLLAISDLIAQGAVKTNFIELTPELNDLFNAYWTRILPPDQQSSIVFPFFHLKGENFWHLVPVPGLERDLEAVKSVTSVTQIRRLVLGAKLDDELFALLQVEKARNLLRAALIETHFAPEVRPLLVEQGTINAEAYYYSRELLEQAHGKVKESIERYKSAARDQGFRKAVVKVYSHRCALCGIRIITLDQRTAVEAAHIIPWSECQNDHITNGMALCRLCHWAFDTGMLGVSPKYTVITAPHMTARDNAPGFLTTLTGRGILGPDERALWPDPESLTWHRRHHRLRVH